MSENQSSEKGAVISTVAGGVAFGTAAVAAADGKEAKEKGQTTDDRRQKAKDRGTMEDGRGRNGPQINDFLGSSLRYERLTSTQKLLRNLQKSVKIKPEAYKDGCKDWFIH